MWKIKRRKVNELGENDFEKLREFAEAYVEICGDPEPNVMETNTNFMYALQILYWSAVGSITSDDFKKRMKNNILGFKNRLTDVRDAKSSTGESKMIRIYIILLECLNKGSGRGDVARIKSMVSG